MLPAVQTWRSGTVLVLAFAACAADGGVPTAPRMVVAEPQSDGRVVEWVDWGVLGPSRARYPTRIKAEVDEVRRWMTSPEMMKRLLALNDHAVARQGELREEFRRDFEREYSTREQATRFSRQVGLTSDVYELPRFAYGIPPQVRSSTQILVFDDRDPAQRDWVLTKVREHAGMVTQAITTGWSSGKARDDFWADKGIAAAPVATDAFAQFYMVTGYPARITFSESTMTIEQGLGL